MRDFHFHTTGIEQSIAAYNNGQMGAEEESGSDRSEDSEDEQGYASEDSDDWGWRFGRPKKHRRKSNNSFLDSDVSDDSGSDSDEREEWADDADAGPAEGPIYNLGHALRENVYEKVV